MSKEITVFGKTLPLAVVLVICGGSALGPAAYSQDSTSSRNLHLPASQTSGWIRSADSDDFSGDLDEADDDSADINLAQAPLPGDLSPSSACTTCSDDVCRQGRAGYPRGAGRGAAGVCDGFWFQTDYLLWRLSGYFTPPLITSSPLGTEREDAGVLPDATVLLGGDSDTDDDFRSGGRVRFGKWFDPCHGRGIEASYFQLETESTNFIAESDGNPALGRPFFNVDPAVNAQDALLVAFMAPDGTPQLSGSASVLTSSDVMSASVAARRNVGASAHSRIDLLLGYRFFRLSEGLIIQSQTRVEPQPAQPVFDVTDIFDTTNQFHGAEVGAALHSDWCRWSLDVMGKVALGFTREQLVVDGVTVTTVQGFDPIIANAGLLAQRTNIRDERHDDFSVLSEMDVKLSYHVTPSCSATLGWSYTYLSRVVRPGNQIDPVVDGRLLLNPDFADANRPAPLFDPSEVWVYGLSLGMEVTY